MKQVMLLAILALDVGSAFSQQAQPRFHARPMLMSAVGFGNDIITHIDDGGGWKTTITLTNTGAQSGRFVLNFYDDNGDTLSLTFKGVGLAATLSGSIAPYGSATFETTGEGAAIEGWGHFDNTSGWLAGYAVFSNNNGNEAAVPFETSNASDEILPFDNTNGYGMGVALANAWVAAQTINVAAYDENGQTLGTSTLTMGSMTHISFILSQQWPFTASQRGNVYFGGATDYAVLGLRFTPDNHYTSVSTFQSWDIGY
jgi:hypothetical protein